MKKIFTIDIENNQILNHNGEIHMQLSNLSISSVDSDHIGGWFDVWDEEQFEIYIKYCKDNNKCNTLEGAGRLKHLEENYKNILLLRDIQNIIE